MSQQQFEEMGRGYQPQANYPPYPDPGQGMQSSDQVGIMSGLKIGRSYHQTTPSIGQRLALAIVSICMLGPIMLFAALVYPYHSDVNLLSVVIALGMVCASLIGINILFYKAGSGVVSPGQRLALAIVSICALALSILMVAVGSFGLIIIGILCITIITINLLFSTMHH